MGKAMAIDPRLIISVPTIHGRIPPLVIESTGICVRNLQSMALQPLEIRNHMTITRAAPFIKADNLKMLNIKDCDILLTGFILLLSSDMIINFSRLLSNIQNWSTCFVFPPLKLRGG